MTHHHLVSGFGVSTVITNALRIKFKFIPAPVIEPVPVNNQYSVRIVPFRW